MQDCVWCCECRLANCAMRKNWRFLHSESPALRVFQGLQAIVRVREQRGALKHLHPVAVSINSADNCCHPGAPSRHLSERMQIAGHEHFTLDVRLQMTDPAGAGWRCKSYQQDSRQRR